LHGKIIFANFKKVFRKQGSFSPIYEESFFGILCRPMERRYAAARNPCKITKNQ
jgi:hypothetical protein